MYRIDSGVDIGPQDLSEEVFNRECLRWAKIILYLAQCFGSGSKRAKMRAEAEGFSCSLDAFMEAQVSGSGSESRRAKMTHKNTKKLRNFMF